MESNRVVPKTRPRPYDLRRKVLLKNFMREQMFHISIARLSTESTLEPNDSNFSEDVSNSVGNEENILTPKKVQDNVVSSSSTPEPVPSTSTFNEKENSNNFDSVLSDQSLVSNNISETDSTASSKFPRLSNLLGVRDKRKNGIKKAKYNFKTLKSAHKPIMKGITNKMKIGERPKEKRNSFFSMFKSRREKKRNRMPTIEKINIFGSRKCVKNESQVNNTSTQSVQTDISWSPGAYEMLEQSNKSLLEENRLLSESLSSMISNTELKLSSKNNYCTDFYGNNCEYSSSKEKHSLDTHANANNSWQLKTKCRVLRSKSVQERCEKRRLGSSRLRTRSMNRGHFNKSLETNSYSTKEPFPNKLKFHSVKGDNCFSCAKTKPVASRNSSHVLPIYQANDSSILMTLPNNNPSKALIRRSSMPERTSNWSYKSRRPTRSNSVRENCNVQASQRIAFRPKQSSKYIPKAEDCYLRPLSVQALPAEAFY